MATEIIVQLGNGGLVPKAPDDAEALCALKAKTDYRAVITRAKDDRSVRQNNMRWKFCELIADNTDGWTKDAVNDALKIATGHVTYAQAPNGSFWRLPKPTDFESMGGEEFTAWLNTAYVAAADLFGAGLTDAVRGEIERMFGDAEGRSTRRAA